MSLLLPGTSDSDERARLLREVELGSNRFASASRALYDSSMISPMTSSFGTLAFRRLILLYSFGTSCLRTRPNASTAPERHRYFLGRDSALMIQRNSTDIRFRGDGPFPLAIVIRGSIAPRAIKASITPALSERVCPASGDLLHLFEYVIAPADSCKRALPTAKVVGSCPFHVPSAVEQLSNSWISCSSPLLSIIAALVCGAIDRLARISATALLTSACSDSVNLTIDGRAFSLTI
mmetsp:Transcript_7781/g.16220  ORF Transcript_7781/g.16220 Transcript_7781/m.16220 type:complete len:236 (-) Transcript_7781:1932-2639(-)